MRFALLAFTVFALGCSSSDDHDHDTTTRPADCLAIAETCHPFDKGTGDIHECHENAESTWSAAECTSNKARCQALCVATDAATDAPVDSTPADTTPADTGSTETSATDASDGG